MPNPDTAEDDFDVNDAAVCDLLAQNLDDKLDNDGKADRLTAYALRLLAKKLREEIGNAQS